MMVKYAFIEIVEYFHYLTENTAETAQNVA